jgi:hypothetical protein
VVLPHCVQQHKAEEEKDKAPSDLKAASSLRTSSYAPDLQNLKQLMPKLPSSISDQPADKNGDTEIYFSKQSSSIMNSSSNGVVQMRDELATKAALKEIDHKKIQDRQRKRQRKTNDQKSTLENEYLKDPNWDYENKCELALLHNFTFA